MDKHEIQSIDVKEVFALGKHLVEFAQEYPFTIIFLGIGVLLDKGFKNYQINNKEEF